MADKPPTPPRGLEVVRTLAKSDTREHLLAKRAGPEGEELVVVQRLLPVTAQAADFREIYFAEAHHAAALDHPNVVHILDVRDEGPSYELVCELVEGTRLDELLERLAERGSVMPIGHAMTITLDVCAALEHAHSTRDEVGSCVLHQDLVPENVVVGTKGLTKVSDFGIGRAARMSSVTLVGGRIRRTSRLSPEQVTGKPFDERSDIYAAGVLLYELTLGVPPFDGETAFELMSKIANGEYRRPTEVAPGYDSRLEQIVTKALAKEPGDRYQKVAQLRADLEAFAASKGIERSGEKLAAWVRRQTEHKPAAGAPPAKSGARGKGGFLAWLRRTLGLGKG